MGNETVLNFLLTNVVSLTQEDELRIALWTQCERCSRLKGRCETPFAASGVCPHPNDRIDVSEHIPVYDAPRRFQYAGYLRDSPEAMSLFLRWQHGLKVTMNDFLWLRGEILESRPGFRNDSAFTFLRDILAPQLQQMAGDFATYYNLSEHPNGPPNMDILVGEVLTNAIAMMPPEAVKWYTTYFWDWHRPMIDFVRYMLWMAIGKPRLQLDDIEDREFQQTFEQAWTLTLRYRDDLYGFRVIPVLSWDDMVRYQLLPKPNPTIRLTISSYFAHQAKAYSHIFSFPIDAGNDQSYDFKGAIERKFKIWLDHMFHPLITAYARRAYSNSFDAPSPLSKGSRAAPEDTNDVVSAFEGEAQKAFDSGWEEFRFYAQQAGVTSESGFGGFLELSENRDLRDTIIRRLATQGLIVKPEEIAQVTFAHYIAEHMRAWLQREHPPIETHSQRTRGVSTSNVEFAAELVQGTITAQSALNSHGYSTELEAPYLTLPSGNSYWSIEQVARMSGLSLDQLRRLDRGDRFRALRVEDVLRQQFGAPPYPADFASIPTQYRIYPANSQTLRDLRLLGDKLLTRQGSLLSNEMNRKTAAKALGVPESRLRSLEQRGLATPKKRNGSVVYTRDDVEQLRPLIKKK